MILKKKIIDLSISLKNGAVYEPVPPEIQYLTHEKEGLEWIKNSFGAQSGDLVYSGGLGGSSEMVRLTTHAGTHLDAPWHYGPMSEGLRAKTIDEIPLEWCFNNGVVLDFSWKKPAEIISSDDICRELERINYTIEPFDIVLIRTDCDKRKDSIDYYQQPGLNRDAVLYLVSLGVKIMGIDAYTLDRRFEDTKKEFEKTGDGRIVWEAHFAGIEKEYCHIEKLCNLEKFPGPADLLCPASQ